MHWNLFQEVTKLRFALFNLPFTLMGAMLPFLDVSLRARYGSWVFVVEKMAWIVVAFFLARTSGMAFNEWTDRKIDAENPRTRGRVLPSGRGDAGEVKKIAWGCLGLFVLVCWQINVWCGLLAPAAAFLIWSYAYTKRFTACAHLVLGAVQFFGPFMAWVAVSGSPAWPPVFLGLGVWALVAGSDVFYAIQDRNFDISQGLCSIPARFGAEGAVAIARICHVGAIAFFVAVGISMGLSILFFLGVAVAGGILGYCHQVVDASESASIARYFSVCNTYVAFSIFLATTGAVAWGVLS